MHENDDNKCGKRIESQYLCLFHIEIVLFIPQFFSLQYHASKPDFKLLKNIIHVFFA